MCSFACVMHVFVCVCVKMWRGFQLSVDRCDLRCVVYWETVLTSVVGAGDWDCGVWSAVGAPVRSCKETARSLTADLWIPADLLEFKVRSFPILSPSILSEQANELGYSKGLLFLLWMDVHRRSGFHKHVTCGSECFIKLQVVLLCSRKWMGVAASWLCCFLKGMKKRAFADDEWPLQIPMGCSGNPSSQSAKIFNDFGWFVVVVVFCAILCMLFCTCLHIKILHTTPNSVLGSHNCCSSFLSFLLCHLLFLDKFLPSEKPDIFFSCV